MRKWIGWSCGLVLVIGTQASLASAADIYKLSKGTPELQSAGPLAFGPYGLLLIGDTKAGAIVAVQTDDKAGDVAAVDLQIEGLTTKIAEALGGDSQKVQVTDLAVNPASGQVYLAASAGAGPAIVRIDAQGRASKLSLENVPFSRAVLPDAPEDKVVGEGRRARNNRSNAITDLAFVDGQVIVSGLSSAAAPSNVKVLPFPFENVAQGTTLEIYHAAHAKVEDYAPVRTFVPFVIDGKPSLLAGFVCTPLVRFDLSALQPGEKVRGTTVAELGNRNQPLDMIVYKKDGKDFLLLANSARGVMKISTTDIEKNAGLTTPVTGGDAAGQPYETIASLVGTVQLDKLGDNRAVVIVQVENGPMSLRTVPLP